MDDLLTLFAVVGRLLPRAYDGGRLRFGLGRRPFGAPLAREGAQLGQTFEGEEGEDDRGVELDAGPEAEVPARLRFGAGGTPGARVGERGVGVGDAQDARAQGYLLAAKGVGVAAARAGADRAVQLLVRWHHEWFGGGGYPDALRGEQIPLGARILRVADAYAALTDARPWRPAGTEAEARKHLGLWAGIEFDPSVVMAFLALEGLPELRSFAREQRKAEEPAPEQPKPTIRRPFDEAADGDAEREEVLQSVESNSKYPWESGRETV